MSSRSKLCTCQKFCHARDPEFQVFNSLRIPHLPTLSTPPPHLPCLPTLSAPAASSPKSTSSVFLSSLSLLVTESCVHFSYLVSFLLDTHIRATAVHNTVCQPPLLAIPVSYPLLSLTLDNSPISQPLPYLQLQAGGEHHRPFLTVSTQNQVF
jgi:hypothetical protein